MVQWETACIRQLAISGMPEQALEIDTVLETHGLSSFWVLRPPQAETLERPPPAVPRACEVSAPRHRGSGEFERMTLGSARSAASNVLRL